MVWCGGGGVRRSLTVHGLAFEESARAREVPVLVTDASSFLDGYFYNQDHHQEEEKEIFEK